MSFPPNAIIKGDLPCKHCGYNLRTLSLLKQCPECGNPVLPSIEAHRATLVIFERPMMAILGLYMLALAFLMDAFEGVFAAQKDYDPYAGDDLRCGALIAGGAAILLAFAEERRPFQPKGLWIRLPFLAAGVTFGAWLTLGFFIWLGVIPDRAQDEIEQLLAGSGPILLQLAAMGTLLVFVIRIVRRLQHPRALAGAAALVIPLIWPASACCQRIASAFETPKFLVIARRFSDVATFAETFHGWMLVPAAYCLLLGLMIASRRKESEALVDIGASQGSGAVTAERAAHDPASQK